MPKPWPVLRTDEEAEHFVATADLTEYDIGAMRRVRFDFTPGKGVSMYDAATGERLLPRPVDAAVTIPARSADPLEHGEKEQPPLLEPSPR